MQLLGLVLKSLVVEGKENFTKKCSISAACFLPIAMFYSSVTDTGRITECFFRSVLPETSSFGYLYFYICFLPKIKIHHKADLQRQHGNLSC